MATHLVDKSAWVRLRRESVRDRWGAALTEGRLALTGLGMLEILVSAKSAGDFVNVHSVLDAMPRVAITEQIIDRAIGVQGEMVGRGTHRAPSPADLILAACAEVNGLVLLHYDHDFDLIADVTGQPMEWVVPAGSVP
ncbi:MAG: PIN domain nuclease [Actinobacteria bacterium]|nr:PIN domain nuclease [Actinomycetota bacterium]